MKKHTERTLKTVLAHLAVFSIPMAVFAQATFRSYVCYFIDLLSIVVTILSVLCLVVFLWGLARYVFKAGEQEARNRGKFLMTWGILALFVLVSLWAIVEFLFNQFGFEVEAGQFLLPTSGISTSPCY